MAKLPESIYDIATVTSTKAGIEVSKEIISKETVISFPMPDPVVDIDDLSVTISGPTLALVTVPVIPDNGINGCGAYSLSLNKSNGLYTYNESINISVKCDIPPTGGIDNISISSKKLNQSANTNIAADGSTTISFRMPADNIIDVDDFVVELSHLGFISNNVQINYVTKKCATYTVNSITPQYAAANELFNVEFSVQGGTFGGANSEGDYTVLGSQKCGLSGDITGPNYAWNGYVGSFTVQMWMPDPAVDIDDLVLSVKHCLTTGIITHPDSITLNGKFGACEYAISYPDTISPNDDLIVNISRVNGEFAPNEYDEILFNSHAPDAEGVSYEIRQSRVRVDASFRNDFSVTIGALVDPTDYSSANINIENVTVCHYPIQNTIIGNGDTPGIITYSGPNADKLGIWHLQDVYSKYPSPPSNLEATPGQAYTLYARVYSGFDVSQSDLSGITFKLTSQSANINITKSWADSTSSSGLIDEAFVTFTFNTPTQPIYIPDFILEISG